MHVLVTWKFREAAVGKETDLVVKLITAFSGLRFAKVFDNTFVVSVDDEANYEQLRDRLVTICQANVRYLFVVMSPPAIGRYRGWLPSSTWKDIKAISGHEVTDVE